MKFEAVKVFSATRIRERQRLGETVTEWLRAHPNCRVVRREVTQSSDSRFHCLTIILFYVVEDE